MFYYIHFTWLNKSLQVTPTVTCLSRTYRFTDWNSHHVAFHEAVLIIQRECLRLRHSQYNNNNIMIKWNFRLLPIGSEKGHILKQDGVMELETALPMLYCWVVEDRLGGLPLARLTADSQCPVACHDKHPVVSHEKQQGSREGREGREQNQHPLLLVFLQFQFETFPHN